MDRALDSLAQVDRALSECASERFRADHTYCTKICRGLYQKRDGFCTMQFGVQTPPVPRGRSLAG